MTVQLGMPLPRGSSSPGPGTPGTGDSAKSGRPAGLPAGLVDRYGRRATDMRLSLTDKCNFRCTYCMPAEGLEWLARDEILTFEEIERLVRVLARMGVREVRLTGGEPLVRRDLPTLVGMLAEIPGGEDLSLTTNGILL